MTQEFTKQFQEAADKMKGFVPQVTFNKNGYEIRTQMLEMAKELSLFEYTAKFQGWEQTVERDPKTGQVVTKVGLPEVPGLDKIIETAEKMYAFVNQNNSKK
jgi:hypothetical protein